MAKSRGMKKIGYLFAIIIIIIAQSFAIPSFDQKSRTYKLPKGVTENDYLPKSIIIKYKNVPLESTKSYGNNSSSKNFNLSISKKRPILSSSSLSKETLANQQKIDRIGINRIFEVVYEDNLSIEAAINEVLKDNSIEYAEPNFIYHTQVEPNDSLYVKGDQSYLAQVKTQQAWDIQPNANGIIIAIVDSGSDLQHEDLAANIYRNSADPINGIDDDNDGYVDNYMGWDFVGLSAINLMEDNNPDITSDSADHGVHVSGLASAVTNNSIGVASIAQTARLMIIKVGSDDNARAIYRGYDGILYAVNHGAKIINCSFGGPGGGVFGQDVIDYAVSKDCLVVAAAGNSRTEDPIYPAAYRGAFGVANIGANNVKLSSSSYGFHISIASPGYQMKNTTNNSTYGFKGGTSMSTPIVSSAAALVWAKFPNLTAIQVGQILRLSADDINGVTGNENFKDKIGYGRLNVFKALTFGNNSPSIRNQIISVLDQSMGSRQIGDTLNIFLDLKNLLANTSSLNVDLSSTSANVEVINNNLQIGNFNSMEVKKVGPFKVVVKPGTPLNTNVVFKISYSSSSGSYQDREYFSENVNLSYQNITVNQVYSTATSIGRIGYSGEEASDGLGFIYKDYDLLYESALMIGNSPNNVSNNARGVEGKTDDHFKRDKKFTLQNNPKINFDGFAVFNDKNSPNPLDIEVKNRVMAFSDAPDDKYILVEYEVYNKSGQNLSNIFIGMFSDWDVDEGFKNIIKYDDELRLGYTYATTPLSPYAGIKILSTNAPPAFYPMSYQINGDILEDGSFTIAEKFQTLSNGIKSTSLGTGNGNDVMYTIGNGPYNLKADSSFKVAFAYIAGDNLEDISKSASQAQDMYIQIEKSESIFEFTISQNYPNPSKQSSIFTVKVPKDGIAIIDVFDLSGKRIMNLYNGKLKKGNRDFRLETANLTNGIYFYRVTFEGVDKVKKMIVFK